MPTCRHPAPSRFNSFFTIHFQARYCRTTAGSQADDHCSVVIPTKMSFPRLTTRVKQRCLYPGFGVESRAKTVFESIARDTSQAKILKLRISTCGPWNDVVDLHRYHDSRLCLTILATSSRSFNYQLAQTICNTRHRLNAKFEMLFNIMSAFFEKQKRLGTQQHLMVDSVNQVFQFCLFTCG